MNQLGRVFFVGNFDQYSAQEPVEVCAAGLKCGFPTTPDPPDPLTPPWSLPRQQVAPAGKAIRRNDREY
jgi:hypothetical protein